MKSFVVALLLASSTGLRLNSSESQDLSETGAPAAAADTRYVPHVHTGLTGFSIQSLEHCPDFNERHSLLNGVTKAVPYPQPGFNCNADYGLAQGAPAAAAAKDTRYVPHVYGGLPGFDISKLEHCPDFNE